MFFKKILQSDLGFNLGVLASGVALASTIDYMCEERNKSKRAIYEKKWLDQGFKKALVGKTTEIEFVGTCMQPYPRKVPVYAWQKQDHQDEPYKSSMVPR